MRKGMPPLSCGADSSSNEDSTAAGNCSQSRHAKCHCEERNWFVCLNWGINLDHLLAGTVLRRVNVRCDGCVGEH